MTRKWFLTVTWIHIWPPSYCSFLVGEEKRNRETDGAKGPSLLFSKVWNGCCPSWIHQDLRSCGRNPKGEKRWSRKEGIRRGGGNPQSVFVKIPKRPLTVLTERGDRTTELGDPGPSSVLWMLFLLPIRCQNRSDSEIRLPTSILEQLPVCGWRWNVGRFRGWGGTEL